MAGQAFSTLVCIYYRVAASDTARAIGAVREFQRGLPERFGATQAQVLVRLPLPAALPVSDALHAPSSLAADLAAADPSVGDPAQATLMETYLLPLPDAPSGTPAQACLRDFLQVLADGASVIETLRRGDRHVELFTSCAS